jgi:flagellar biosynthesis protein
VEREIEEAVAIKYEKDRRAAPHVVAAGKGPLAQRIVEVAAAAGVPVLKEPRIAGLLANLPPGTEIPPDLYQAVAEILVFIYRMDRRCSGRK